MTTIANQDCLFCSIISRRAAASIVREDRTTLAFMDLNPVNPGHVLIVPREHAAYLADLPVATGRAVFDSATEVAAAIRKSGVRCEGINFFLADGEAAGQEVFHLHLHVFPRYQNDGFGLRFGPHYKNPPPSRIELDRTAAMIRGAVGKS